MSDDIPPVSPDPDTTVEATNNSHGTLWVGVILAVALAAFALVVAEGQARDAKAEKHRERCQFYADQNRWSGVLDKCMDLAESRRAIESKMWLSEHDKDSAEDFAQTSNRSYYKIARHFCTRKHATQRELILYCDWNPQTRSMYYEGR